MGNALPLSEYFCVEGNEVYVFENDVGEAVLRLGKRACSDQLLQKDEWMNAGEIPVYPRNGSVFHAPNNSRHIQSTPNAKPVRGEFHIHIPIRSGPSGLQFDNSAAFLDTDNPTGVTSVPVPGILTSNSANDLGETSVGGGSASGTAVTVVAPSPQIQDPSQSENSGRDFSRLGPHLLSWKGWRKLYNLGSNTDVPASYELRLDKERRLAPPEPGFSRDDELLMLPRGRAKRMSQYDNFKND